jgi:CheY-like chemotaxis protein
MKIMIVEDSPARINTFKQKLNNKDYDLYFFDTAVDAEAALKNIGGFDVLFLDHDLGGQVFVDSKDPNTGYAVAKFIVDNKIDIPSIIVHSMNPVGSQNIKSILPKAEVIPFPLLFN